MLGRTMGWMVLLLLGLVELSGAEEVRRAAPVEINSVGMELVDVPAGDYLRGRRPWEDSIWRSFTRSVNPTWHGMLETPEHEVHFPRSFQVSATEVTVGQFREFVEETDYRTAAERGETTMLGWVEPDPGAKEGSPGAYPFRKGSEFSWKNPGFDQTERHPVVGVTYSDAVAFCEWLSEKEGRRYRLPTEAEWEYICRAGTRSQFSFGDVPDDRIHFFGNVGNVELEKRLPGSVLGQWVVDVENDPSDYHLFTAPVGRFMPNDWGVYDMHGNVWEWCQDQWRDTAYENLLDEADGSEGKEFPKLTEPLNTKRQHPDLDTRVMRGGSFFTGPVMARSGTRAFWVASDAAWYLGFRGGVVN